MLQLAPRGEIAIPMAELEDPYLLHVKTHHALRVTVRRFRPKLRWDSCKKAESSGRSDIERRRPMHSHSIDDFRHAHVFLGQAHKRNERKTWTVIAICTAMMVAEIVGGLWFGSVALVADGLHMSTHAGALLIAALAYTYSRRYARDDRSPSEQGSSGT
jgi:hypothetical protein